MVSPTTTRSADKQSERSGFTIERTAKRMKQVCQQMLKAADSEITVDQWLILQELDQLDGQGQNEIARKVFKDAPTVTRIIDLLCKKGLTERANDPDDRRKFNIHLTPAGRRKIVEVHPVILQYRQVAHRGLSERDLELLRSLLDRIFENLQD